LRNNECIIFLKWAIDNHISLLELHTDFTTYFEKWEAENNNTGLGIDDQVPEGDDLFK
jgi:hypothetical protein